MTKEKQVPGRTTPKKTDDLPLAVAQARRQAANQAAERAFMAGINKRIAERRLADDSDPFHEGDAASVMADHDEHVAKAESIAKAVGTTVEEINKEQATQRAARLQEHLDQWEATRLIHIDMRDNPDIYGGVDLGGQPLDQAQQAAAVMALDAAIAEIKDHLNS